MYHYQDNTIRSQGGVFPSPTIQVFNAGLQTMPTIYSDNGITPKANPFVGDTAGRFDFYVANGTYDVVISGPGITTVTLKDVSAVDGLDMPMFQSRAYISGSFISHVGDVSNSGIFGNLSNGSGGRLVFAPIQVFSNITVNLIRMQVNTGGTAGQLIRMGIYTPGSNGLPLTLLLDAGTVDVSTSGTKDITINQALTTGLYWLAAVYQGTLTTLALVQRQGMGANSIYQNILSRVTTGGGQGTNQSVRQDGIVGALPTTTTLAFSSVAETMCTVTLQVA